MNHQRITRLLKLLQLLQAGNGSDALGLAKACGVSRRTIFRDLEALRTAGVPLEFDTANDRYSIESAFFLPPTNFTAEEALAIIALASKITTGERLPFSEPARQAAMKLESSLPVPLRDELRDLTRSIQINLSKVSRLDDKADCYLQLVTSLREKRAVRVNYSSLTEWQTITTTLRPYQLLFSGRSWYVIGRSSLHREIRTFNLTRIEAITSLSTRYSIPRDFQLEKFLGNAWHLVPDSGPDHHIVVRFQPLVAKNVSEVVWHKTQRIHWREDGTLDFSAQVSGLQEIAWWILGYGDQAEVIRPLKLRKLVASRVANMQRMYNGGA